MIATIAFLIPLFAAPPTVTSQPSRVLSQPINAKVSAAGTTHRGAPFELTKEVSLDDIMDAPEKYAQKAVRIKGTVKKVCLKKGCWLILAGAKATARARVTFKDYAFFAPMDCVNYSASVEGIVQAKTLSEGERAHLAEDGKVSINEIPKAELRIIATAASFTKK